MSKRTQEGIMKTSSDEKPLAQFKSMALPFNKGDREELTIEDIEETRFTPMQT
jgi:hypothetical protein